ncbi:MAG: hypothetical protein HRU06_14505 [Oceanospirillaceae bacterium]|nr:hypothetical protein [Oceanospirillaceae bacterium]
MRGSYKTRLRAKRTRQKTKNKKRKIQFAKVKKVTPSNKISSKSRKIKHCYMCEKEAVTVEHVPPKCLFPEKKDVSDGVSYREQLITVPSCEDHNTKKSSDDEYILYVLVMNIPTNQIGKNQFSTKVMRAIQRRPQLMNQFLKNQKEVYLRDLHTGLVTQTIALDIDMTRFISAIEMMVKALYYNHFSEKCCGEILINPNFLFSLDAKNSQSINQEIQILSAYTEKYFEGSKRFGNNSEVFYYQVTKVPERSTTVFKLMFYGDCSITVFIDSMN